MKMIKLKTLLVVGLLSAVLVGCVGKEPKQTVTIKLIELRPQDSKLEPYIFERVISVGTGDSWNLIINGSAVNIQAN